MGRYRMGNGEMSNVGTGNELIPFTKNIRHLLFTNSIFPTFAACQ